MCHLGISVAHARYVFTMIPSENFTLNVNGRLVDFSSPQVMGIVNLTPDSFYAPSRKQDEAALRERVAQVFDEGGTMLDVGAYSSRPGAAEVTMEEEMSRLRWGLKIIGECLPKDAVVSVDTFRADVARMCVEEYGVGIVNDISGGELDPQMFKTVAEMRVPYILMHMKGTPQTMQEAPHYEDLLAEMFLYFSKKVFELRSLGVSDIILDPGFGFAKTLDHNYELLCHLEQFAQFELPLLVGVSRKSMIFRLLGCSPSEALNGTTVINTIALQKGADILRVHDVKEAAEAVCIFNKMQQFRETDTEYLI